MTKCTKQEFLEGFKILKRSAQLCLIDEYWINRIGDHDAELWEKAHELHNAACEVLALIGHRTEGHT